MPLLSRRGGKAPSKAACSVRNLMRGVSGYLGTENSRRENRQQGNSAHRGHKVHVLKYKRLRACDGGEAHWQG